MQAFNLVGKNEFSGYPLKVEYFITERSKKCLKKIKIMQEIGIEIMKENGMDEILHKLGFQ